MATVGTTARTSYECPYNTCSLDVSVPPGGMCPALTTLLSATGSAGSATLPARLTPVTGTSGPGYTTNSVGDPGLTSPGIGECSSPLPGSYYTSAVPTCPIDVGGM